MILQSTEIDFHLITPMKLFLPMTPTASWLQKSFFILSDYSSGFHMADLSLFLENLGACDIISSGL